MHFFLITLIYAAMGGRQVHPDSTFLTFTLEKDIFTVRLLHWSTTSKSAAELNQFVDAHLSNVDPNKIIIIGDPDAKYYQFKAVIEVMKKHDWLKFRLIKKGELPKAPKGETAFRNKVRYILMHAANHYLGQGCSTREVA
jgi:hypothetical protein